MMPKAGFEGIPIFPSAMSIAELEYEVANGTSIRNIGERRCQIAILGSDQLRDITFQVADVHKPLLSVSRCADMGYECRLGKSGGVLIEMDIGEEIPLARRRSVLNASVDQKQVRPGPSSGPGFIRQG